MTDDPYTPKAHPPKPLAGGCGPSIDTSRDAEAIFPGAEYFVVVDPGSRRGRLEEPSEDLDATILPAEGHSPQRDHRDTEHVEVQIFPSIFVHYKTGMGSQGVRKFRQICPGIIFHGTRMGLLRTAMPVVLGVILGYLITNWLHFNGII
ncbi:hypothetical protein DFH07DRAFT_943213 [Mycena maculata]|uniref:Uncharacterized protein n=1 Tax=Mycena maculata TaxID=230809 RepID=A0AAD7IJF9_9AGAR|nr:hypothetical protein DFH07DRAFT_943213 [Mycena maculata]